VDDETVHSLARLPEVVDAEGVAAMSIRWKPSLDAEWQSASVIALDDYEHKKFDLVELRSGRWPDSKSVAVEFNHVSPYRVPAVGGTIYFEVNDRAKPMTLGGTVRDPQQFPPPFTEQPAFYAIRDTLVLLGGYRDYSQIKFTIPAYSKQEAEAAAAVVEKRLNKLGVGSAVQTRTHSDTRRTHGRGRVGAEREAIRRSAEHHPGRQYHHLIAQQVLQIGIMKTVGGLAANCDAVLPGSPCTDC
jgi:hypothetical protein